MKVDDQRCCLAHDAEVRILNKGTSTFIVQIGTGRHRNGVFFSAFVSFLNVPLKCGSHDYRLSGVKFSQSRNFYYELDSLCALQILSCRRLLHHYHESWRSLHRKRSLSAFVMHYGCNAFIYGSEIFTFYKDGRVAPCSRHWPSERGSPNWNPAPQGYLFSCIHLFLVISCRRTRRNPTNVQIRYKIVIVVSIS